MTSWRSAKKLRIVSGVCHICKGPADGRTMFQTRFCDLCLKRGMDLEYGVSSPYAIIPTLYKIQTTYADIALDIERVINSVLPQKNKTTGDKKLEEGLPSSPSSSNGLLVHLTEVESLSVDSVPLPSIVVRTFGVKSGSG